MESILDVCCGKGGDIAKLFHTFPEIEKYIGIDSSMTQIKEGNHRLRTDKRVKEFAPRVDLNCVHSDFYNEDIAPNGFDFVCCNFALHYFFKNESILRSFLAFMVNQLSKEGGILWFVFPDGDRILELPNLNTDTYDTVFDRKEGRWGHEYLWSSN